MTPISSTQVVGGITLLVMKVFICWVVHCNVGIVQFF